MLTRSDIPSELGAASAAVTVVTWNTEWRSPTSPSGKVIRQRLREAAPDVVCLTEADVRLLHDWGGHVIEGGTNWGGPSHGVRRKVLLWSRKPWSNIDIIGHTDLPPGMFASGTTQTSLGEVAIAGLLIPYFMANVRHGRRDRKKWEDHELYLRGLPRIFHKLPSNCVVMGDFNQRIPSKGVPRRLQDMLMAAFQPLGIVTSRIVGPRGDPTMDHVACGGALTLKSAEVISNLREDGRDVSDHFGIIARFGLCPSP